MLLTWDILKRSVCVKYIYVIKDNLFYNITKRIRPPEKSVDDGPTQELHPHVIIPIFLLKGKAVVQLTTVISCVFSNLRRSSNDNV